MTRDTLVSPGLLKSLLKRFWPLWLAGMASFVLIVDVMVYGGVTNAVRSIMAFSEQIDQIASVWTFARAASWSIIIVASIVVAIAINEHLFSSRSATFIGSIPLRRHTVFCTTYLAGLLPLLGVPALAGVLLVPLRVVAGSAFALTSIAKWYLTTALLVLALYSFAQLACQLAGTRAIAVLLYAVIVMLAACLEAAVSLLIPILMYGITMGGSIMTWLAPGLRLLIAALNPDVATPDWLVLVAYAVAGFAVTGGSCALYVRRNLETAGNSISYDQLRPVLRNLAGVSMALLFSSIFCLLCLATDRPASAGGVTCIALALVTGGFLGVLFAEMIMSRSTHVLAQCWRDALVLAVVACAFVGICRFDVPRVVHYVPEPSEVASVSLDADYIEQTTTLTSPEGIAQACDLQRDVIAYGGLDTQQSYGSIDVSYQLKDGRRVSRHYPVRSNYIEYRLGEEPATEGALLIDRAVQLAETDEGRASRFDTVLNDKDVIFELEWTNEYGEYHTIELSAADHDDLVAHALRQDLLEGDAGLAVLLSDYSEQTSSKAFDASLTVLKPLDRPGENLVVHTVRLDEEVSPHLVEWVREHYPDVTMLPLEHQWPRA